MSDISVVTFSLTRGDNGSQVSVVFSDGSMEIITDQHSNFQAIIPLLLEEPEGFSDAVRDLINIPDTITRRFRGLSDRVTTDGTEIYFDGDAIHSALAKYLLKLLREDAENSVNFFDGAADQSPAQDVSWHALVKFLEKLYSNPNPQSRESLYEFITRYGLTIREDGNFIAYKGLQEDFGSINKGYGIVNGVEVNGTLMNTPGSILRFPRKDVDSNTGVGCSQGLHAGTHRYASDWARGGKLVSVAINPMNVVSVPDDCTFQKIRVCEYEILSEVDPLEPAVATSGWDSASYWDDRDECEDCGQDEDYCDCEHEDACEDCGQDTIYCDCYCPELCCATDDEDEDEDEDEEVAIDSSGIELPDFLGSLVNGSLPGMFTDLAKNTKGFITEDLQEKARQVLADSGLADLFPSATEESETPAAAPATATAHEIAEGDIVSFDYVGYDGIPQSVAQADVEQVEVDYFTAYVPEKVGYRSYRFDAISNVVRIGSKDDKTTSFPTVLPDDKVRATVATANGDREVVGTALIANEQAITLKLLSGEYLSFGPSAIKALEVL